MAMDIVVIANQKGGCAKTTTTVNLAAGLGVAGRKVLVVDLDPQANTTTWLGSSDQGAAGAWQLLTDQTDIRELIQPTQSERVSLVAGSRLMAGLEKAMSGEMAVEARLKRRLAELDPAQFDIVLIDTPPTLGLITLNAMTAAHHLLVPVTTHVMSLSGVAQLLKTVEDVKAFLNPHLRLLGLVASRVDARTRHSKDILDALNERFGDKMCKTLVRENVRLAEAPSFRQSIFQYSESSSASEDYRKLSAEVLRRLEQAGN